MLSACPVVVFEVLPVVHRPFGSLRLHLVLSRLRRRLVDLGIAVARSYRTHDFRRGHARDLQASGASLLGILQAGEWRSPVFMKYIDKAELEADLVVQAHVAESSATRHGLAS